MVTIAVVAMGEMGSSVAQRLAEDGVLGWSPPWTDAARPAPSRARAAGAEVVGELSELVGEADSSFPCAPGRGEGDRNALRQPDRSTRTAPVYVDCNAIAPQTLDVIAKLFSAHSIPIVDGSIIGGPPRPGYSPKLYLSGDAASAAQTLRDFGIDARAISARLGDASALKMAFAGLTKGFQALSTAMAIGAARTGVEGLFLAEVRETLPFALRVALQDAAVDAGQGPPLGRWDLRSPAFSNPRMAPLKCSSGRRRSTVHRP